MNKTFYKASLLGLILGAGYVANAQQTETNPPGVGIQTDDPQETLDVRGTVKITDLPSHKDTDAMYNGQPTKSGTFTATKTVVADAQGVLGSLPYILPAGDETKTSLKWNQAENKWEPSDEIPTQEPWNKTGTIEKASENNQDIYQNGKVTIGNVETADKKSAQDASFAVYNTDHENKKMIALFNNNNERFYIGKGDGNRMIFSSDNAGSNGGQNGAGLTSKFVLDTSGSVRFGQDLNEFVGSKVFSDSESNKAYFIYDAAENKLVNRMVNGNEGENGKYIGLDLKVVDKQVSDPTLANIMAFSGSDNRIAMLGDVDKAANSARIFDVRAENGYRLRLQALQNQRVIIDGAGGTEIKHVSANDESNDVLVIASDGLVGKKQANALLPEGNGGQVLKHNGTVWVADTDTSLANTNQTITEGEAREVAVNGSNTTLTFSSDRADDKNVIKIKKDNESLTIMPNTSDKETYIGFHKDQGADYTGYIGHIGADDKSITVGANKTDARVILDGDGGARINKTFILNKDGELLLGNNLDEEEGRLQTDNKGYGFKYSPTEQKLSLVKGNKNNYHKTLDIEGLVRVDGLKNGNTDVLSDGTPVVVDGDGVLRRGTVISNGEKSPWFLNKETVPANDSNSTDNIYHNGNVVIGNVSQENINDGKLGAKLLIAGGGTAQLRLAEESNLTAEEKSTWDISAETSGDKKGISFTLRSGLNKRTMSLVEGGSMYLGDGLSTITDAGSFHYDGSNKKLNLKRVNNTSVSADISGKVAIGFDNDFGTTMADDYALPTDMSTDNKNKVKLAVNGAVVAGSFKGAHGAKIFPDYVFQKYYTGVSSIKDTYNFNTLSQVENFVKEYGHLPGYKSAAEIKEQGYIDLMDTQLTNVEKIEELYLHSIEQDKEIKAKDAKIKELEARLERLEKLLK